MIYQVVKYKKQWAIFSTETKNYMVFGTKKRLEARVKELNAWAMITGQ